MSTNVKSSRVLRLSKTRFPSFSNPANLEGITGPNSVQTPLTPQSNHQTSEKFEQSFTQAASLKSLMNYESKSMYPIDLGIKVNSKIPKQVIELSASNTRQASRDTSQTDINVAKPNSKPAYHKRSSNTNVHDLSSITDKLNISNISKVSNISNISFTRGSGLSERANIDSDRICISNSVVFPKDFPVQSLNDFEENFSSKASLSSNGNHQNLNHKKSSRTSHGNSYRETLPSSGYHQSATNNSSRTNHENMRHQQSGSSGGRTPSGQSASTKSAAQTVKNSLQKLETVPLCKVIDLTSGSGYSKESSVDKPFSMGHPILLERSFNRCEMSQISQLLKEQKEKKYVKGSKENSKTKQYKIKSNQNENENNKDPSPKTLVLTPELAARASNQQAIQMLLARQKGSKDNTRYQGDNSPNFEDSPVKVNQIRACKKPNTNEKGKEDPLVAKQSFQNDLKILADELKSKRDKQSIKKQLLLKKSPLMYHNKQNSVLESAKQKIPVQSAKLTKDNRSRKKRYVEYLSDENIFGTIVDFFCIKTLCLISRVCKQFRSHDMLALIKKAQCRLILKGFNDDEQYDFWDLHANFSYLQKTYPLQFAVEFVGAGEE